MIFQRTGRCRFGASCTFAHAATLHSTRPTRARPTVPSAPAAVPEKRAMDNEVQSGKRALKRAAAAAARGAAERVATEAQPGPPSDSRHLFCHFVSKPNGCTRGEACCFAHGPVGTLSPTAWKARDEERRREVTGAAAIMGVYLSVLVKRPGVEGPRPVASALASPLKEIAAGLGRRICFQLVDEVIYIEATGTQLGREHYQPRKRPGVHSHTERRKASVANNLASGARAIQSAWNLAWEAGSATEDELPDRELVQEMQKGLREGSIPRIAAGYVARGPWILDSGASDFLVGASNLSKREN
jgi:hypothetical protein